MFFIELGIFGSVMVKCGSLYIEASAVQESYYPHGWLGVYWKNKALLQICD